MTIEEYNAHIFAQIFGQALASRTVAITQRNLQQLAESVAVPVECEVNPNEG